MARPTAYPIKKVIGFDQEMIDAIEAYRRTQDPIPNQSEAIRQILDRWLSDHRFLKANE